MTILSPNLPEKNLAAILLALGRAVDLRRIGERLAVPVIILIVTRLTRINQHFARLAARIRAGRPFPQPRSAPRRAPASSRKPRAPNPLPQGFGWLLKLAPEAVGYRSQLEHLLQDREMAVLLQAAPGPMRRPLRSLCQMLGVPPPPILALPARPPRPPRPPRAAAPKPPPPPPRPPLEMPAWMHLGPPRKEWPLSRTRWPSGG